MITTKLLPYTEVPHQTMPLQNWLSGLELKSTALNTHAVAASNDKGIIVVTCCYFQIDDAFLITTMKINPKATAAEKIEAGNGIDRLLEEHAQRAKVATLYLITPGTNECTEVRVYKSTQVKELQAPSRVAYLN